MGHYVAQTQQQNVVRSAQGVTRPRSAEDETHAHGMPGAGTFAVDAPRMPACAPHPSTTSGAWHVLHSVRWLTCTPLAYGGHAAWKPRA